MIPMRRLLALSLFCAVALAPGLVRAEETIKPVTIHGRLAKPGVVIILTREKPNLRPAAISPPKSFSESK